MGEEKHIKKKFYYKSEELAWVMVISFDGLRRLLKMYLWSQSHAYILLYKHDCHWHKTLKRSDEKKGSTFWDFKWFLIPYTPFFFFFFFFFFLKQYSDSIPTTRSLCVFIHICIHTCTHTQTYVHLHCSHIYIYTYTHTYMCVFIYVYLYIVTVMVVTNFLSELVYLYIKKNW